MSPHPDWEAKTMTHPDCYICAAIESIENEEHAETRKAYIATAMLSSFIIACNQDGIVICTPHLHMLDELKRRVIESNPSPEQSFS
jgi:hypothetical protein